MKKGQNKSCPTSKRCYTNTVPPNRRSEPMNRSQHSNDEKFKILRAADPAVVGGTKPLQIAKEVHFQNAQGGLRLVTTPEVRILAANSAQTLLKALGKS